MDRRAVLNQRLKYLWDVVKSDAAEDVKISAYHEMEVLRETLADLDARVSFRGPGGGVRQEGSGDFPQR